MKNAGLKKLLTSLLRWEDCVIHYALCVLRDVGKHWHFVPCAHRDRFRGAALWSIDLVAIRCLTYSWTNRHLPLEY